MDLKLYFANVRRFWPIPLVLLLIGVGSAYGYLAWAPTSGAEATVAVLDPLNARPGGYTAAQVTMDAVVKSQELANRVALDVHEPASIVHSRISVALLPALHPLNPSPLYAIRGKGKTQAKAIVLTNAAVAEAIKLYQELNRPDPEQARAVLSSEKAAAQADLSSARAALDKWERDNNATDYPILLAQQSQIVFNARMKLHEFEIYRAGLVANYGSSWQTTLDYRGIQAAIKEQQAVINDEQRELNRLRSLQTKYAELSQVVALAQSRVGQVMLAEEEVVVGQLVPTQTGVKILDSARPVSLLVTDLLIYGSAVVLALFLAALVIYGLAWYRGQPLTAEAIAAAFKAPVLVRFEQAG